MEVESFHMYVVVVRVKFSAPAIHSKRKFDGLFEEFHLPREHLQDSIVVKTVHELRKMMEAI